MTNYYKPLPYSTKHKNLQWINCICGVHDLHCSCDDPLKHTILGIIDQEPSLKFNKEDTKKIQKCLTTGEDHGEDVVEEFGDGELEKLFEEDIGEEDDDG